jgi:hypothetical protein
MDYNIIDSSASIVDKSQLYRLSTLTGSILGTVCSKLLIGATKITQFSIGLVKEANDAFIQEVSPVYSQSKEIITSEFTKLVK